MTTNCKYCESIGIKKPAFGSPHPLYSKIRPQGGTDNPINLIPLCFECHYAIHHGTNTELRDQIKDFTYQQIKDNLSECWSGKIKPKIIRILENRFENK